MIKPKTRPKRTPILMSLINKIITSEHELIMNYKKSKENQLKSNYKAA